MYKLEYDDDASIDQSDSAEINVDQVENYEISFDQAVSNTVSTDQLECYEDSINLHVSENNERFGTFQYLK